MSMGSLVFSALKIGLSDFRRRLDGESGDRVRALGRKEGTIADLVRQVLKALADALSWLATALQKVAAALVQAEAVLALLDVANTLLDGLTDTVSTQLVGLLGPGANVLGPVQNGIHEEAKALQTVAAYVPSSDDILSVESELDQLLGTRARPDSTNGKGILGRTLSLLGAQ